MSPKLSRKGLQVAFANGAGEQVTCGTLPASLQKFVVLMVLCFRSVAWCSPSVPRPPPVLLYCTIRRSALLLHGRRCRCRRGVRALGQFVQHARDVCRRHTGRLRSTPSRTRTERSTSPRTARSSELRRRRLRPTGAAAGRPPSVLVRCPRKANE